MEHKKTHQLNQLMRSIIYFLNDSLLYDDRLILRHQCLHDTPAYEVSHTTDAEYNHVSTWLAIETHEGEGRTLTLGVGEEHTGTLVDEERTICLSF